MSHKNKCNFLFKIGPVNRKRSKEAEETTRNIKIYSA